MWPNNSFRSNGGPYPNNFNEEDDFQYAQSPFGLTPDQPMTGQPFLHQQQNDDPNRQPFLNNGYQPEIGPFNQRAFMQNQFVSSSNPQFTTSPLNSLPFATPSTATPNIRPLATPQINARAAELKAQLLKNREIRENSATPPVKLSGSAPATKQKGQPDTLRQLPQTPVTTAEKREQELNLDELISSFSDTKRAIDNNPDQKQKAQDASNTNGQHLQSRAEPLKSQVPKTKAAETVANGKYVGFEQNIKNGEKNHKQRSSSDASEGEILEDREPAKSVLTSKPMETVPKAAQSEKQAPPKSRDSQVQKSSTKRTIEDSPPPRRTQPTSSIPQIDRKSDDTREDINQRLDRRPYFDEYRHERKCKPESERQLNSRRASYDDEYYRRTQTRNEEARVDDSRKTREQKLVNIPTLIDLLPHDEDLREWLEITGYNNASYRNKILGSRRELARLDAQREKVVAEMQAATRVDLSMTIGGGQPTTSMLPPPIPNDNVGGRAEQGLTASSLGLDGPRDRVISNKRPRSDVRDFREEYGPSKLQRVEDKAYSSRARDEEDLESRHLQSNGFNNSRRSSFDRRDDVEPSRLRFDDRARSREREYSPGPGVSRSRTHDMDSYYNRDEFVERGPRNAFEVRGKYKGRAYDPNYRGRGRGKSRGDIRDSPEPRGEIGYGSRIANGRPYKDPKGFEKGSRGDTRYFIVKSFNEENVIRCIEDSVWTTQLQNGPIFKEAFETCKNVILVFSINKSRAFQGYARMESLPGSVETPQWQKQINWESAGAFKVKWLVIYSTRFHLVGHLKNPLNENQAVLIGKDGQEIESECAASLIDLIDNEANTALADTRQSDDSDWEVYY